MIGHRCGVARGTRVVSKCLGVYVVAEQQLTRAPDLTRAVPRTVAIPLWRVAPAGRRQTISRPPSWLLAVGCC